jgi:hypothetical protein
VPHLAVIDCIGSYVDRVLQGDKPAIAAPTIRRLPPFAFRHCCTEKSRFVRVTGLANQPTLLVIGLIAAVALVHLAITNLAARIALLNPVAAIHRRSRHAQSDRVRSHSHYRC